MPLVTLGMIEEAKKINTKKGDPMIFMKLSDYTDSIENVIFPKIFEKYASIIREGNCVAVKGRHSTRNGEHSILVEEIKGDDELKKIKNPSLLYHKLGYLSKKILFKKKEN